jgi:NAD(P)-dependent dehydrogenase (short-subunit alcohol dehydrogenase family)
MSVRFDFSKRAVFVTGGSSGIGRAVAAAFVGASADVTIASRDREAGERAVRHVERAGGGRVRFVPCDVRDEAAVARAVGAAVEAFGRLDFAVNCAGVGGDMAPLETAGVGAWDDVMAVNARGVWLAMRAEIAAIAARNEGGAIVNMGSIYSGAGRAAHHAYVASKHAVLGMTRSVALEYAARGIRVNAICAGVTRTAAMDQVEQAAPSVVRAIVDEHPMRRMATEAEIAAAALWLCSGDSGFVTGAPLYVDGGYLAA